MLRSHLSDVELPDNISLPGYILNEAARYGDKVAFINADTEESLTFNQLIDNTRRLGSALRRRGCQRNDVVLVFSPNCLEYPSILFATNYIGAILTTCNPIYTEGELISQLVDSKAKFVITIPEHADKVTRAINAYRGVNISDKEKFVIGDYPGYTSLSELLTDDGSAFAEAPINPREDACLLPYSSGTTGKSKGVMLTHFNMISMVQQLSHPSIDVTRPGEEVLLAFLPFYHVYAICVYLTWCLRGGHTTVILSKFDLKQYLESVQKYKVTFLHMVPPVALMLCKSPLTRHYDLSSLTNTTCGAAPFGREQAEELMSVLGVSDVRQGYGLTETSAVTHVAPIKGWKHGSVGILLPNMECKIIDTATGKTFGANQDGEILLRGPSIMKGYLNNPEATRKTFNKEGWLLTGDIGHYDEDGHFYIVDRVKELIKYNGLQVPPAELESILLTHPAIADAAVVGVPHEQAGELPRAYVVRKPGTITSELQVAQYVQERVAPYKKLRGGVVFITEIPKSGSGKILRRELKLKVAKAVKSRL